MRTRLGPIRVGMYRTNTKRLVRVTYRCNCARKHPYHWRFEFEVLADGTLCECDEASTYLADGCIEETLLYAVFDFMEWRAMKLAEHFLSLKN